MTALSQLSREGLLEGAHIDVYWEQAQGRLYKAFNELRTAARTDPKLAAVFDPAMAEFDRAAAERRSIFIRNR